jgi:hypothetical protein
MSGTILLAADEFIRTALRSDATIFAAVGERIFGDEVPEDEPLPLILFQSRENADVRGLGKKVLIMNGSVYLVRVMKQATAYEPLRALADRIDVVLDGAEGTVASGEVIGMAREQEFKMVEEVGGVQVRHLGGLYRVFAK